MGPTLLQILLFVAVASARTIDIHITEDDALSTPSLSGTECVIRDSFTCQAECESDEETCHADVCGEWGCCIKGFAKKVCCTGGCPQSVPPTEEKQQHTMIPVPAPAPTPEAENGCHWEGTAPFCETGCARGRLCGADKCGDGACCFSGLKSWCCDTCPNSKAFPQLPTTPVETVKKQHVMVEKPQDNIVPAPRPKVGGCHWEGTAPFCSVGCNTGRLCGVDPCGDGSCCFSGWKSWCCEECPSSSHFSQLPMTPVDL